MKAPTPDTFHGFPTENVDEWIFSVELYYAAQAEMPEDLRKVAFATTLLRKNALAWWRNHMTANPANAASWDNFCTGLRQQFRAHDFAKAARDKLATLRQTKSVATYNYHYNSLIAYIHDMSDGEKLHTYLRGLKPYVRMHVELNEPWSLDNAMKLADRVDHIAYTASNDRRADRPRDTRSNQRNNHSHGPTPMELGFMGRDNGNNQPRGKLSDGERKRLINSGGCFYCRQDGHFSTNCPNRPKPKPGYQKRDDYRPKRLTFADVIRNADSNKSNGDDAPGSSVGRTGRKLKEN